MLLMTPNDALMFRESKPFGIDHRLARTTLPLPQTVAGAIRSAIYLKHNSDEARELIGFGKEEPEFEILGTFLYLSKGEEVELVAESPLDVTRSLQIVKPYRIDKMNATIFKSNESIHIEPFDGFLKFGGLINYLHGRITQDNLVERGELFTTERRVGIALTEAKVTKEGHFYQTEMLRLCEGCGLAVWIKDDIDLLDDSGILRLGGEGGFVRFWKSDEPKCISKLRDDWKEIQKRINKAGRLKIYLTTPAIFEKDGYKSKLNQEELHRIGIERVKNVFPLIGKPIVFSGWDYVAKKPKSTKYAVPAGSVYFVEFEGEISVDEPYVKIGKLTKLGYGLCFLGVW